MVKKYNVRSAGVLNSADALERRINQMLFVEEQDRRMFGPNEEIAWLPGDPIHKDPRDRFGYYGSQFRAGPDGNWVRPIYEIFNDLEEFYEHHFLMRCEPCGVDWDGPEPCWVCGEERRPYITTRLSPLDYMPLSPQDLHRETVTTWRGPDPHIAVRDEAQVFYDEAALSWAEYIQQDLELTARLFTTGEMRLTDRRRVERVQESGPRQVSPSFARIVVNTPRQNRRSELLQWLIDEMADVLEVPRELITTSEPVTMFGVELPADWATRRPDVPLPDTPEPRDFSDWVGGENFWIREDRRWR